ncbi:unnamed protein product, partial [Bubo scandiacus]
MEPGDGTEETPLALARFQLSEEYGFLLPHPLTELPAPLRPLDGDCPRPAPADHQPPAPLTRSPDAAAERPAPPRARGAALGAPGAQLHHHGLPLAGGRGEGTVKVLPPKSRCPRSGRSHRPSASPPSSATRTLCWPTGGGRTPTGLWKSRTWTPSSRCRGAESLRGFILVTLLVEKAAVPGIKAIVQAIRAILQLDHETLHEALQELAEAIGDMTKALARMHDFVDPAVFYAVIRIFLSGWKDNPAMPGGLVYEGVSDEPLAYSGGSAAQSTVLHAFDELLGIRHSEESTAFLHRMRHYMPPPHRAFVEEIHRAPSLRQHVALLRRRSAPRGVQPLRLRAGRLQVLPHHHRHQVHRHRGHQSQSRAGRAGRQPRSGEAPVRAGGQRDRRVPHLQLPKERQGHHEGGVDQGL